MVLGFNYEKKQLEKFLENVVEATGMNKKRYNHYLRIFQKRYEGDRKRLEGGYGKTASTRQLIRRIRTDLENFGKEGYSRNEGRSEGENEELIGYMARFSALMLHLTSQYIPMRQDSFEDKKKYRAEALNVSHDMSSELQKMGIETAPLGEIIHNNLERKDYEGHTKRLIHSIGSYFKKE